MDILVTFHSTGTFAHLLGVHDQYIPATWADAHAQSDQVLTPILSPTMEGKELAEVLLGLTAQIDLGVTRGFLNEFVRYQLGHDIGDWLGLKRDYISAATIKNGWPLYISSARACCRSRRCRRSCSTSSSRASPWRSSTRENPARPRRSRSRTATARAE